MRRILAVSLFFLAVVGSWLLLAPKPDRQTVVGVLMLTQVNEDTLRGFKIGLAEHGWLEGENIQYLFQGPAETRAMLNEQAQWLVGEKPDLIFTSTTPATLAAKKHTIGTDIPVVFAPVNNPLFAGVLANIRRPEGNITGVRLSPSEGRRLQALLELAPGVHTVFVPHTAKDRSASASLVQLAPAARTLGVKLVAAHFSPETDLGPTTGYVPRDADAIFLPREGMVMSRARDFAELATSRGIPVSGTRLRLIKQGVTTGYGFVGFEIGRQAARMAHLLLTGTPVRNLPVETAQDYLFINTAAARAIGLEPSTAFLRRAHYIIRD